MSLATRVAQEINTVRTEIGAKSTAPLNISSMLKSTASLTNTIQAIGFNSFLYTGDGNTRDIVTGVDMKSNWEDYSGLPDAGSILVTEPDGSLNTSTTTAVATHSSASSITGTASADSEFNTGAPAWEAFDGNIALNQDWASTNTALPHWLQYAFISAKAINKYSVTAMNNATYVDERSPKAWTLEASNTGVFGGEEVVLDTVTNQTGWTSNQERWFTFTNGTEYTYYRLVITENESGVLTTIAELKLIEAETTTQASGTFNTGDVVKITDTSGRILRCVCLQDGVTSDPNTLLDFTDATFSDWKIESKTFGGRIIIKNRDGSWQHAVQDTIRGVTNAKIATNTTDIQGGAGVEDIYGRVTSFNSDGFSLDAGGGQSNQAADRYVAWSDQTTFVESFLTSHNKPAIRETNSITGYCQIVFKGSGDAGHEIEHGMGKALKFLTFKNTDTAVSWYVQFGRLEYMVLNSNGAQALGTTLWDKVCDDTSFEVKTNVAVNGENDLIVAYGHTDAYKDENDTLQGNYQVMEYIAYGLLGREVELLAKPTHLMIKEYRGTGDWTIYDITRQNATDTGVLYADLAVAEGVSSTSYYVELTEKGFKLHQSGDWMNNGTYLVVAVFGDDLGKSLYDQPTDTIQLQEDALFSVSNGYNTVSGVDNKINTFSGTVIPTNGWSE